MEKISLYDFFSIILPGAILTFVIHTIIIDLKIYDPTLDLNQYFTLTIFLSSSLFLGSLNDILTRSLLGFYKKIKLNENLSDIYKKNIIIKELKPFYKTMMDDLCGSAYKGDSKKEIKKDFHNRIEKLWSEVYYELEAKKQIAVSKNFQSFHFFFRNFFTLSLMLFIPLLVLALLNCPDLKYVYLFIVNLFALISSQIAGRAYRKKMTERLFWTYYSLNKNK